MAKIVTFRCDRCGKESIDEIKIERYRYLRIERGYQDSSSLSCCGKTRSFDLCNDCNKILHENIKNFLDNLNKEFNIE